MTVTEIQVTWLTQDAYDRLKHELDELIAGHHLPAPVRQQPPTAMPESLMSLHEAEYTPAGRGMKTNCMVWVSTTTASLQLPEKQQPTE